MRFLCLIVAMMLAGCVTTPELASPRLDVVRVDGELKGTMMIEVSMGAIVIPIMLDLNTSADALSGEASGSIGLSSLGQRFACTVEAGADPVCELIPERR